MKKTNFLKKYLNLADIFSDTFFRGIFKNSSKLISGNVGKAGINFVNNIIFARYLGVEKYGLLVLIIGVVSFVNQFLDIRFSETLVKYLSVYKIEEKRDKIYSLIKLGILVTSIISLLYVSIIYALNEIILNSFFKDARVSFILILLYALCLIFENYFKFFDSILMVFNKYSFIAFVSFLNSLGVFIFLILLIFVYSISLFNVLFIMLLTRLMIFVLYFFYLSKKGNGFFVLFSNIYKARIQNLKSDFKSLTKFVFNTNLIGYIRALQSRLDIIILGAFLAPVEIAYYKIGFLFISPIMIFADSLHTVIYPEITKLIKTNGLKKGLYFIKKYFLLLIPIVVIMILAIIFLSKILILFFYTEKYLPAKNVLIIAGFSLIWLSYVGFPRLLYAADKSFLVVRIGFISTLFSIILMIVLGKFLGMIGVAIGRVSYLYVFLLQSMFVYKKMVKEKLE